MYYICVYIYIYSVYIYIYNGKVFYVLVYIVVFLLKLLTSGWHTCAKTCWPTQQLHLLEILVCRQEHNEYIYMRLQRLTQRTCTRYAMHMIK
jgi:hypothetical protein